MSTQKPRVTSLPTGGLALAAVVVLLFGVTGCSPENIAERVVEAGSDGNVDIDTDDGQVTIDSPDGGTATFGGSGDLPEDFPDAVPVVKGTIGFTQSMTSPEGGTSFTVLVTVAGQPADVWEDVKSDLAAAGFTMDNETTIASEGDSYYSAVFSSAEWEVAASVSGSAAESNVSYVVTSPVG